MYHSTKAKHIDIEHLAYFIFFAFFNGCKIANARIVDENINAPELIFGYLDSFLS